MSTSSSPLPDSVRPSPSLVSRLTSWRIITSIGVIVAAVGVAAVALSQAGTATAEAGTATAEAGAATAEADEEAFRGLTIPKVETVVLEPTESIQQARTYTGVIAARRTAEIGFERPERVVEMLVDEGDAVTAGQPLARLDTRHLDAQRRETAAQLAAAAARLEELVAGPRQETIAAARATVADLQAQLELRRRTYERTVKLRDQYAATDQDIDDSRLSLQSTEARLRVAEKQLEELEVGTRPEQLAAQRANVDQLEAALAKIDVELSDSLLVAPFDGCIAARHIDEGTVVASGQTVLRIVESGVLEARIGLPSAIAQSLVPGDSFALSTGSSERTGTLIRKLPEIDAATRTQTVIVSVDPADAPLFVPGQVVQTSLTQQINQSGFLLPTPALLPGVRGLWSVFAVVSQDGRHLIERRYVEVLHTSGNEVLLRGTLSAGDRVVTSGVQRLVHGQFVQLPESME